MRLKRPAALLGLALLGAAAALGAAEGALALLGAPKGWAGRRLQDYVVSDVELGRRLSGPGRFSDWNTRFSLNALGMRGPLPDRPVVLGLGDSCTFGVGVRFAQTFLARLAGRPGGAVDAAMPGYTAFEGLQYLREPQVSSLRPKLVVVYFGWNDHSYGLLTQRELLWLRRLSGRSRLAFVLLGLERARFLSTWPWKRLKWRRVNPAGEYRRQLEALARRARGMGAVPVIVTGGYDRLGWVNSPRFRARVDRLLSDQDAYNEAARRAARESGAGLVDFARAVERLPEARRHLLFADGVHPTAAGHLFLAGLLRPWLACARAGACPPRGGPVAGR